GLVGLFLGVLRGQAELSLLSLSVLVWLAGEWALFSWRVWCELPRLQIERTVNGRSDATGLLWAGRTVTIVVRVTVKPGFISKLGSFRALSDSIGPVVLIHDVVPENLEILSTSLGDRQLKGNQFELRARTTSVTFTYTARVRAAGQVTLPGIRLRLRDAQEFFLAERFIKLPQTFRVLPAYAEAGDVQPLVKRTNSLPRHGIHRLQRSGLGSELLELREYVPGDPPKAIAWKVSARRDRLMTRQYESEVPVRVQLFIDGSMSTRLGGFGCRLLDQMTYVAASVARAAISVGDPVGAILFDERGARRLSPLTGERGFYRLLDALADFSINPALSPQPLSPRMVSTAMSLAGERYPELLDRRVNQVPFTLWPLFPWSRRRFRQQFLLAGILAEVFQLSAAQQVRLVHDPGFLSAHVQRFLTQSGVAWMEPVVAVRDGWALEGARLDSLSDALVKGVSRARDNEVFVVLADLLDCSPGISHLLPAVKMALGRHHRVAFVCPSPTFQRPTASSTEPQSDSPEDLVAAAEQIRARELALRLQRELRRLGAAVSCSGEKEAIHLVLSEMEI
ncbi:MAG: DUF58 domain-containing protein, partial [Candidatus Saccharimonas sp.]|nr:DUF58 domain-containing protein [Planctomycetaceae bacterium]